MLDLIFKPLQTGTWDDFVTLFGERGSCGGCRCMLWRLTRRQFAQQKGQGNKLAMQAIVNAGQVPGILAYHAERDIPAAFAWTGIPKAFRRAGFKEATRRSPTRPIMRRDIP